MNRAHIIRAIRDGKLSTITRSEWLDVADVLAAAPDGAVSLDGHSSAFDLAAWFDAKARWSAETFGPENGPQRYEAVVRHIRKELVEVERDPSDLEEWCDVVMLAMDGAWRSAGADGAAFVAMLEKKHAINLVRVWRRGADGTIEHVRGEAAALEALTKADVAEGVATALALTVHPGGVISDVGAAVAREHESIQLRERLAASEQRNADLAARLARVLAAANGEPA